MTSLKKRRRGLQRREMGTIRMLTCYLWDIWDPWQDGESHAGLGSLTMSKKHCCRFGESPNLL